MVSGKGTSLNLVRVGLVQRPVCFIVEPANRSQRHFCPDMGWI